MDIFYVKPEWGRILDKCKWQKLDDRVIDVTAEEVKEEYEQLKITEVTTLVEGLI
jgi:hypothetical protein